MINLEQIQSLERQVNKAVELISRLREENRILRQKISGSETKIRELESLIGTFKNEQDAIEKGILTVLAKLDKLEDEVSMSGSTERKDIPRLGVKKEPKLNREPAEGRNKSAPLPEKNALEPEQNESAQTADQKQEELDIF